MQCSLSHTHVHLSLQFPFFSIQELSPFVEAYLRLHPEVKEEVEGLSFEEKLQLSLPGGDLLVFGKIDRFLIRVLAPFLLCVYVLRDPF